MMMSLRYNRSWFQKRARLLLSVINRMDLLKPW